jgi:hypothetical protein
MAAYTVEFQFVPTWENLPSLMRDIVALVETVDRPADITAGSATVDHEDCHVQIKKLTIDLGNAARKIDDLRARESEIAKKYNDLLAQRGATSSEVENRTNGDGRGNFQDANGHPGDRVMIRPHGTYNMNGFGKLIRYEGRGAAWAIVKPDNHDSEVKVERKYIRRMKAFSPLSMTEQEVAQALQ